MLTKPEVIAALKHLMVSGNQVLTIQELQEAESDWLASQSLDFLNGRLADTVAKTTSRK